MWCDSTKLRESGAFHQANHLINLGIDTSTVDPLDLLGEYACDYDARHVELRDGALYYHHEGTGIPEPRRLYPVSDDTFVDGRRDEGLRDLC